jgi:hypothetical protein
MIAIATFFPVTSCHLRSSKKRTHFLLIVFVTYTRSTRTLLRMSNSDVTPIDQSTPNIGTMDMSAESPDANNNLLSLLPRCSCGMAATTKLVAKNVLPDGSANPNLGREFWCCSNTDRKQQCDFFQWCDGQPSLYSKRVCYTSISHQDSAELDRIYGCIGDW